MWGVKCNNTKMNIYNFNPQDIYNLVDGIAQVANSYKKRLRGACNIPIEILFNSDHYFERWFLFFLRKGKRAVRGSCYRLIPYTSLFITNEGKIPEISLCFQEIWECKYKGFPVCSLYKEKIENSWLQFYEWKGKSFIIFLIKDIQFDSNHWPSMFLAIYGQSDFRLFWSELFYYKNWNSKIRIMKWQKTSQSEFYLHKTTWFSMPSS